jgi:hypothetical protein
LRDKTILESKQKSKERKEFDRGKDLIYFKKENSND